MKPLPNQSPRKHSIVLLILVAILNTLTLEAFAYDFEATNEDGVTIYYNIINDGKELEVAKSDDGHYSGVVNIPDSVEYDSKALPVTSIGSNAFWYCSSLTSVTIPNSVTSIGEFAFANCDSLTTVTIPNSVISIGESAFSQCHKLASITILDGVTSIGKSVFKGCSHLASITIPSSVTNIGDEAFHDCSGLTSITIPSNVTSIGDGTFRGCSSLTSIAILGSVTSIGESTFEGCSRLTSVSIPSSVTSIGVYAFSSCSSLTSVTIPNSVTSINLGAFNGCSSLTSVTIPSSVTSINECAFSGCINLTKVISLIQEPFAINSNVFDSTEETKATLYVPEGTVEKYKATEGWNEFAKIDDEIPKEEQGEEDSPIQYNIINNGTELEVTKVDGGYSGDIIIPATAKYNGEELPVTSIGESAFSGCSSLTSITIPNSVTSIGSAAFANCLGLTSVSIPSNVTNISDGTFNGCSRLTTITIPTSVTSIGESAFGNCSSLTSIAIPNSVTSIGRGAFWGCSGLTSITIPSSITSIGDDAFYGCSGLTSVTIPSNVTSIGKNLFYGCSGLTSVTIPSGVTSIGKNAFYGCSVLTSISIPSNVTSIGESAFYGCSGLTSVTIPSSVTSIGKYAFSGCSNIVKVTSLIQEPFAINSDVFDSDVEANATLYVPVDTKGKYAATDGWKEFKKIDDGTSEEKEEEKEESPIKYDLVNNGTAFEITKVDGGYSGDVTIPATAKYNGKELPVTSICDYAFSGCEGLTSVTLPSSITSIGEGAFSGCSGLTTISIPSSVTNIGKIAFYGCTSLVKVVVEDISAWCGINFENEYANPLYQARHLYNNEFTEITDLVIPSSVKTIGKRAFYGCIGLKTVSFGSSLKSEESSGVTEIGEYAFYGCSSLTSVIIPGSVTSIGDEAFNECNNLVTVTSLIEEPFTISTNVFSENTLKKGTLYVPKGTVEKYKLTAGWKEFLHIVTEGSSTGIEDIESGAVKIQAQGGALHISGVAQGTRVEVYSMTGARVASMNVTGGSATIPTGLRKGTIAVVRIGDTAMKVLVQ